MDESALRRRGRLGQLKWLATILGLLGVALLIGGLVLFGDARANDPDRPAPVEVGQLVRGEVPRSRYVSVAGYTDYSIFYTETSDGSTVARYYFLVDDALAYIVLVRARGIPEEQSELVPATIVGMTRSPESGLQDLLRSDQADIADAGLESRIDLYVAEGQKPPTMAVVLALVVLGLVLLAGAAVLFAFPTTVFAPAPVEPAAAVAVGDPGVQANGTFLHLKRLEPLEVGRRTRRFEKAVANLVPLADGRLLVYIHHVVTTRTYGIQVGQQESDWGVLFGHDNALGADPGKLYAVRERPAVLLRYRDPRGREQELVVSFHYAAGQAGFLAQLRQMGFTVGTGLESMGRLSG